MKCKIHLNKQWISKLEASQTEVIYLKFSCKQELKNELVVLHEYLSYISNRCLIFWDICSWLAAVLISCSFFNYQVPSLQNPAVDSDQLVSQNAPIHLFKNSNRTFLPRHRIVFVLFVFSFKKIWITLES